MRQRLSVVILLFVAALPAFGQPLGTSFTYQGRLTDNSTPATGPFDFQLMLFDAPSGGVQVGPVVTLDDVAVSDGLFTVTPDFGGVFQGSRRWLEVGVRPGASGGAYTVLSPRQELTAAPGSLFSSTAPWTGILLKPAGFADDVDNDVLGGLSCATGEIPKFDTQTGWACSADADTTYTEGTGISIVGTTINIATGGVTSALIQDGTIAAVDLAPDSVTGAAIAVDAVGAAEIATGAVGAAEILDGAIGAADLAADSVTATAIAADAVGAAEIAADAVGASEIATGAVGTTEIADGTVGAADLAADSVTATAIATGAVGTDEILNGAVGITDLDLTAVDARYLNTNEELTGVNYGGCGTYSLMPCSTFLAGQVGPACNSIPVGGICRVIGAAVCAGTAGGTCGDGSTWYLKVTP